jgi:hypothetical protein
VRAAALKDSATLRIPTYAVIPSVVGARAFAIPNLARFAKPQQFPASAQKSS